MGRSIPMEKAEEMMIKAVEFAPLQKLAVETGKAATLSIHNKIQYIANLTQPRNLMWLGYDREATPMDVETALFVRDNEISSAVREDITTGIANMYGNVLISGGLGQEALISAASAIASVKKNEDGDIEIVRKKQMGLSNKHGHDLVKEYQKIKSVEKTGSNEQKVEYRDTVPAIKQEDSDSKTLELITEEEKPPLKEKEVGALEGESKEEYTLPWT